MDLFDGIDYFVSCIALANQRMTFHLVLDRERERERCTCTREHEKARVWPSWVSLMDLCVLTSKVSLTM